MKDFQIITEGIKRWNKVAHTLREANQILQLPIEFLINEELSLDNSPSAVNVYFGYQDNALFAVLIQASKDLSERYRNDIEGVLKDMVIVPATRSLVTITTETNMCSAASDTQIETACALKRIARWENELLRMKVMKAVNTAPLIFEAPKVNFEVQGQKKLVFGLKIAKRCYFFTKLEYDLLLATEYTRNLRMEQTFYDRFLSIPPHKFSFSKGLYDYLGLSI